MESRFQIFIEREWKYDFLKGHHSPGIWNRLVRFHFIIIRICLSYNRNINLCYEFPNYMYKSKIFCHLVVFVCVSFCTKISMIILSSCIWVSFGFWSFQENGSFSCFVVLSTNNKIHVRTFWLFICLTKLSAFLTWKAVNAIDHQNVPSNMFTQV